MKACTICKSETTPKWYSGPICKTCYGRQTYKRKGPKYWSDKAFNYRRTEVGSYNVTKGNAKHRGIPWNLSIEEFREFKKTTKCHYCSGKLPLVCGGLDRMDNNKGYSKENLVRCCVDCNDFKRDFLSFEEMLKTIKLLKRLRNGKIWNKEIL